MEPARYGEYQREVIARLEGLLTERYGRDGDLLERGYKLSLVEAGYRTIGLWSALQSVLNDAGTSFQTEETNIRLDLLLQDLLEHPDDPPTSLWSQRYGYATPSAAARAFRARFGFTVAYARRMGRLGQWLAAAQRAPRGLRGLQREQEARLRLAAFKELARVKPLGRRSKAAVRSLGAIVNVDTRPRYLGSLPSEGQLSGARR